MRRGSAKPFAATAPWEEPYFGRCGRLACRSSMRSGEEERRPSPIELSGVG